MTISLEEEGRVEIRVRIGPKNKHPRLGLNLPMPPFQDLPIQLINGRRGREAKVLPKIKKAMGDIEATHGLRSQFK